MNLILSKIREVSIKKDTKIYIIGEYVRSFILGQESHHLDCIVEKNLADIQDEINQLDELQIKNQREDNLYKVNIDSDRDITIRFISMEGSSIEETLLKRGFTVDSMAIDILDFGKFDKEVIIDPYGGLKDIQMERIRHNSKGIFTEKPINILKAIRLMSELAFDLYEGTRDIIVEKGHILESCSTEEISEELFKILKFKRTYYYFNYMERNLNILKYIFPEILPMKDVGECKYHVVDVFTHSIYTLKLAEEIIYHDGYFESHLKKSYEEHSEKIVEGNHGRLELIKLGAFFHDVGKPSARRVDDTGRTRFRGHEITGAEIIVEIGDRLNLSKREKDILYRIVSKHMIPLDLYKNNDVSGKTLYGIFSDLRDDTLDVLLISLADIMATRVLLDPNEEMGKFKVHIEYIANNYLTRFKEEH